MLRRRRRGRTGACARQRRYAARVASLEIGIIGLPNCGKTSVFNALTGTGAPVTDYAATTPSANRGVAPVPDERLDACRAAASSRELIPATVEVVDVSGLVRGGGRDGGLGGEFLQHLRAADALIHVVRCFTDDAVFHVDGRIDPADDAEAVDLELLFADAGVVQKRIERQEKAARTGAKEARAEVEVLGRLLAHLEGGAPVRTFAEPLPHELDLLTAKPLLYVANTDETGDPERVAALRAYTGPIEVVPVAAKFEAELAEIEDPDERALFLGEIGLAEPAAPRVAAAAFRQLDLIQFFTIGPKEARAWPLRRGSTAVEAAGKIHTDFERGFIRAEVIAWPDFVACNGSSAEAQKRALQRVEGRDYVVQDGDVINVRFNV